MASGTTPLVVSLSFSVTSSCSATLGRLLGEGRTLAGMSLLASISLEAVSVWEPEELDARIAEL